MIRINLVAGERRAAKTAAPTWTTAHKVTIGGSALLLVAALGVGWRYQTLTAAEAQGTTDIAAARREETRLAEVLKQVSDFEAQRTQLQQRVSLIDELKRGQTAPVHIIDQISRALPEMTWLTNLTQNGLDVTIEGRCTSLTALSDFVSNLEGTRYFRRPVEIVASEVVPGKNGPDLIEFTIKGAFHMAGIERPASADARPAKKGAAKGGKVG